MHLEPFVMHTALPARPQPLVMSLQLIKFDRIAKKKKKKKNNWHTTS